MKRHFDEEKKFFGIDIMASEAFSNAWEGFLEIVEPHLPEYLHWNEICVSRFSDNKC